MLQEEIRKCCFTGYRPSKFPFNLDMSDKEYREFDNALIEEISNLINTDCRVFYSGMAMGFDIIAAETVILLKKAYKFPIKLIAVIPFEEQKKTFTSHWQERYYKVLESCDESVILSKEYFKGCYQKRNEYMINNSDYVLTWFDGKSGGTRNTLKYAEKKGRFVLNINKKISDNFAIQTTIEIE